jgi:hypothetical protein
MATGNKNKGLEEKMKSYIKVMSTIDNDRKLLTLASGITLTVIAMLSLAVTATIWYL